MTTVAPENIRNVALVGHSGSGKTTLAEALLHRAVVIEPIPSIEITVPIDLQGDVIGHLNTHRARVGGTHVGDLGEQVIDALVPTSELRRYAVELRSLSRGSGTFHAEHEHDVVADHLVTS